ncbi:hypothetical protein McanMca71_006028 [Microsporum canis]
MAINKNFCPENIPIAIQKFRNEDDELARFKSNTLTQPLSGGQCQIYRLGFSDDADWAIRIPIHLSSYSEEEVVSILMTEIKILKHLENCRFPWSPKVIGYDVTFDNPIGFPFLVLNWIPGEPLSGSALEYFTDKVDQKIIRICQGRLPELEVNHCLHLKCVLPEVLHPELDNAPSFIEHGDISARNIIVDSEYNIKGIIDWGFSNYQPFQLAASLPRFLAVEHSPDLELYLMLQKDRANFLRALRQELPNCSIMPLLLRLYSAPDVDYRRLVLEAVRLVNYNGTSLPWPAPTQGVEEPYISVWSKAADGTFRPNEYRYSQDYKEAAIDLAELGFIKEFDKLVQRHDASDLFGLCLYPGDDFEGSCEITVGRANINLKPADVRTPSLNVTLDPNEALQYPSDL